MLSIEYHSSATSVFLLFIPQVLALPGYIAFMEKKKKILLPARNQNYFHQYLFSRKALKMLISDFYCNSALGFCEVQPQRMRRPNSRCEYSSIGRHFYIYDRIKLNCVLPVFDWVSEVRGNHRLLILA